MNVFDLRFLKSIHFRNGNMSYQIGSTFIAIIFPQPNEDYILQGTADKC